MARKHASWIIGNAKSGKTTYLVKTFQHWFQNQQHSPDETPSVIILSANHTTAQHLSQSLTRAVSGKYPIVVKTPLGFIEDEINLFLPLCWKKLKVTPQFPLKLRPETEQTLATKLWHSHWPNIPNNKAESRLVRTTLDILQLAGASGTPLEEIESYLTSRLSPEEKAFMEEEELIPLMAELILMWRNWCLERGFLTYGLIYYLYSQVLLPDPFYQAYLQDHYQGIFADDVDDYPAIAQDLAAQLLQQNAEAAFTFNPNGKMRLGLGADPDTWEKLATHCEIISLPSASDPASPQAAISPILEILADPVTVTKLPDSLCHFETPSRSQLLRKTAKTVIKLIQEEQVSPEDIAIIAPGLDEIARYTLIKILSDHSLPVNPLNEQRPLITSSLVRALLSLTCFVYPNLGQFLTNHGVAEMLVILTEYSQHPIDPVRAGLIADYCYQADPNSPHLLEIQTFPRWDRIGYKTETGYNQIRHWIEEKKAQNQEKTGNNLVDFFNEAISKFLWKGNQVSVANLTSLKELTETTQHYWEVKERIAEQEGESFPNLISEFIQILKQGTITANPEPNSSLQSSLSQGITIANIFQYRSSRTSHRYQFWLDISSNLWEQTGVANLFASSAFLRQNDEDTNSSLDNNDYLQRIITDLLGRATEKVYLCHSDLTVNGNEQTGILLSLLPSTITIKND